MSALHLTLVLAAIPGNASERASKVGVHRSTLHRWTTGVSAPREEEWERLAKLVGVDLAVLRYGPTPVLRSLLPKPAPTRAEVIAMSGSASEIARATGLHRGTVARWRR